MPTLELPDHCVECKTPIATRAMGGMTCFRASCRAKFLEGVCRKRLEEAEKAGICPICKVRLRDTAHPNSCGHSLCNNGGVLGK